MQLAVRPLVRTLLPLPDTDSLQAPISADEPVVLKVTMLADAEGVSQYPVLFKKETILAYCRKAESAKPDDIKAVSKPWQTDGKDATRWRMLLPEELVTAYQMLISGLLRWHADATALGKDVAAPLNFAGDTVAEILSQRGDRKYLSIAFSTAEAAQKLLAKRTRVLTTASGIDIGLADSDLQCDPKMWGKRLRQQSAGDATPMEEEATAQPIFNWNEQPPATRGGRGRGRGAIRSRGISKPSRRG